MTAVFGVPKPTKSRNRSLNEAEVVRTFGLSKKIVAQIVHSAFEPNEETIKSPKHITLLEPCCPLDHFSVLCFNLRDKFSKREVDWCIHRYPIESERRLFFLAEFPERVAEERCLVVGACSVRSISKSHSSA